MKLVMTIEASADGYDSEEAEMAAIIAVLEDCDSSGFTIRVLSCEKEPE